MKFMQSLLLNKKIQEDLKQKPADSNLEERYKSIDENKRISTNNMCNHDHKYGLSS
jgi:hypothetical protein